MNGSDSVDVKIPQNYTGNPVRIIVDKERVADEKLVNFISFNIHHIGNFITVAGQKD